MASIAETLADATSQKLQLHANLQPDIRMIIPEAKTTDGYRLSIRHLYSYEKAPSCTLFEAGFIESVYLHGFNKAQDIRSSPAINDDTIIDALFRDMMRCGHTDKVELTDLFVRAREGEDANHVYGAQKPDDSGRRQVPNALWLRAEAITKKAWMAAHAFAATELEAAYEEVHFDYGSGGYERHAEVTLFFGGIPILSLFIRESIDARWNGCCRTWDNWFAAFHFKYEPNLAAGEVGWMMPTWVSVLAGSGVRGEPEGISAGHYTFTLRDEHGEFEVGGCSAPHFRRPHGYDDRLCIINGLIRIHNHLNNPGMTDEAYRQLLG